MSLLRNRQLLALSLGHFGVDMYPNILPVLYPLMFATLALSYTKIGLLQLIYTLVSSLSQPVFGYLADRYGARFFAAGGVIIAGVFVGLTGFAWDYVSLVAILACAALGVAAFHPQGAMNTAAVTTDRQRATGMAIFMLGGNTGFAVGPMLGLLLLASPWGIQGTALLPIPAIFISIWLSRLMIKVDSVKRSVARAAAISARSLDSGVAGKKSFSRTARPAVLALIVLIGVVMFRSWAWMSVSNFLPLWYAERALSPTTASQLLSIMLLTSAAGGIGGGFLADRYGRRRVLGISLLLSSPAMLLFLSSSAAWAFPTGVLLGLIFGSSSSITLVMAQELLPRSMGVASGLILGLAFVTGGIGVAATGWLADAFDLTTALNSLILLPALAALCCIWLQAKSRPTASVVAVEPAE